MRYIVIDELSLEEREYENIKDAYEGAEKNNGTLLKIDDDGNEKIIAIFN